MASPQPVSSPPSAVENAELAPVPGWAIYLGSIDYQAAWELQLRLVERRTRDELPDLLLLCQHPDVLTVGRRQLAQRNILAAQTPALPVFEVERGGDVTYHGPGQLVGYPILRLRPGVATSSGAAAYGERDLHRYLRALETALIELCGACGVPATRREGYTGVWTADHSYKLASLGIAVRRWITFHGFALNVTTELARFSAINPCGLPAAVMSSLAACRGHLPERPQDAVSVEALLAPAAARLGAALQREFSFREPAAAGLW